MPKKVKKEKKNSRLAVIFVLSCFMLLFGCDKYTKHQVLSFFFTGVPSPDEEKVRTEEKKVIKDVKKKKVKGVSVVTSAVFSHGPFAAEQCYYCHATSESAGFKKNNKEGKKGGMASLGEVGGKLAISLNELCRECHASTKSNIQAYKEGLWVHGPVGTGSCTMCHSPHSSPNRYMLLEKAEKICTLCHSEGYIMNKEIHKGSQDCLLCHNPHVGKNKLMLKKDYNETF